MINPANLDMVTKGTTRQKQLFEEIHEKYYEASDDPVARAYKEEHVYKKVLEQLGDAESLIEIASGIGAAAGWLKRHRPQLEIAGCDISECAAEDFRRLHHRPCYVADLTQPFDAGEKFDAVIVMGGIHHLVADLDMAFANIRALLKPGGRLIMAEPNSDYFLEPFRKIWYNLDRSNFDSGNEHALSHTQLFREYGKGFRERDLTYFGGIAYYLLTLNWVLRIPNRAKHFAAPFLMRAERLYHKLPGRLPFASFIACWELD